MKIEIEIPDWVTERRLLILAGTELVAKKEPWDDFWEVKNDRCNLCGACCMTFKPNSNQTPYGVDEEGKCKALVKYGDTWECSAGTKRPYECLFDPKDEPDCCITTERVKA